MAIPAKIKKKLEKLDRTKRCECCGDSPVQWHHCETYQGKQINEVYMIRALCADCHMGNSMKPYRRADLICKRNAIREGLKDLKKNYPKRDWEQELRRIQYELNIIN